MNVHEFEKSVNAIDYGAPLLLELMSHEAVKDCQEIHISRQELR